MEQYVVPGLMSDPYPSMEMGVGVGVGDQGLFSFEPAQIYPFDPKHLSSDE